jgi:hypothetical protein
MNRQERAAIWRDEVAHPGSPTTWAAMQASGANMALVDEWRDLEGQPGEQSWMTYEDFLKGAIGIAADHDPKTEFDTPADHISRLTHQCHLWIELEKVTTAPHNELGEDRVEHELWARRCAEQAVDAQRVTRLLENARDEAALPSAVTESILELPGELYVRYDPASETFLGFGFTPVDGSHPGFAHLDGPDPGCDLTDPDNPVWRGMREYLSNVRRISGEWSFAVQWTEDGWRVQR